VVLLNIKATFVDCSPAVANYWAALLKTNLHWLCASLFSYLQIQ